MVIKAIAKMPMMDMREVELPEKGLWGSLDMDS